jgi:indolepyruvate ferredoxin oxidoreductase alpha subunit
MSRLDADAPGSQLLLMGNEAIARGALEAGIRVAAAYPGNPSSEIIGALAAVGPERGLHVEWSANEKVALEVAAAASLCGLRGLAAMKQNGLNVASDFLLNLNLTGTCGGLVLAVCDDPSGLSSTNEEDSRPFARIGDLPLLEPSGVDDARQLTAYAFELSEQLGLPVLVRSVTRVSHARSNVQIGPLPPLDRRPALDLGRYWISLPVAPKHRELKRKLAAARELFESCRFNGLVGPEPADLLVVAAGSGWAYAREAVSRLGAAERVSLLRLATTWPVPPRLVLQALGRAKKVLVLEEVDAFVEDEVKALAAQHGAEVGLKQFRSSRPGGRSGMKLPEFFGRRSGLLPEVGELDPDLVTAAMATVLGIHHVPRPAEYAGRAHQAAGLAVRRTWGFCAGCPHRASYWAIKRALALDGRGGFVLGDIGCYSLGFGPSGFGMMRTMQAMGSGTGLACGMAALRRAGLDQPCLAICGDSTFFHAVLPALVNARYNAADLLLLVLDNSATAMTGFQPHPGTGRAAQDRPAHRVEIEALCRAVGAEVEVGDPFELAGTADAILRLLRRSAGLKVLILRQECALLRARSLPMERRAYARVDSARCIGDACGCSRLCTRVFRCPGLVWDAEAGTTVVDRAICTGCGVCQQICPAGAITLEETGC